LDALASQGLLTEVEVARSLSRAAPDAALVVLGPSTPPRSWFLAAEPRTGLTVLANRGAAGMDGLCSSAVGAALAHQRAGGGGAYGLLGDLTLLHDSNGLAIGPAEPRPDLTVVAVNNRGGAIFELLEQGGSPHREAFERVFRTDAGFDLGALARAHGVPHERVASPGELAAALRRPPQGLSVLEAVVPPGGYRELFDRLHAAGAAALRSAL
ncbi:MAG: thiamine pyrophosphate-binding protein, partial [Acidimicrobiales bacterium]